MMLKQIKNDLEKLISFTIAEGTKTDIMIGTIVPTTVLYLYCSCSEGIRQYYLQYTQKTYNPDNKGPIFFGVVNDIDQLTVLKAKRVFIGDNEAPEFITMIEDKLGIMFPV